MPPDDPCKLKTLYKTLVSWNSKVGAGGGSGHRERMLTARTRFGNLQRPEAPDASCPWH